METTLQQYADLCRERNHTLLNKYVEVGTEGKKTYKIKILCNTCEKEFDTSCHSYKNARKTGCPNCKKESLSKHWTGKVRTASPEQIKQKKAIQSSKQKSLEEKAKKYEHIKNKNDLIEFLKQHNDEYSSWILECIDKEPLGENRENHHIIPKHAGGPDTEWNLIKLSPEEHVKAHEIRARVYGDSGDLTAIRLRGQTGEDLTERRIKAMQKGDATRKDNHSGIYAPGISSKGGKIGGSVKSVKKDLKQITKMTSLVADFLYNGGTLNYKQTGLKLTIIPGEFLTLPPLIEKLKEITPEGQNKVLLNSSATTTISSLLGRVLKKERQTAYGWSKI
jgi:RNA polymerase subunit RPABC4/transcription elongation factor Spt4